VKGAVVSRNPVKRAASSTLERNLWLALGVLLVATAAWLVDAMQLSPRGISHERDAQRIDGLLAGRRALEVGVLEARAGLDLNFDVMNRALLSLRDVGAAAETLRARGSVQATAAEQLELAARALDKEEALLERFKTDLALLQVSSLQLPLAAETLLQRADVEARGDRHSPLTREVGTLAALLSDVGLHEELPHDGVQRLEQELSQLQTLRTTLDDSGRDELDAVSGHARAIVDRRERVDRFVRTLVRSPVRVHLEAARSAYEHAARGHIQKVGALQLLSGLLALAGVLVLARAVLRGPRAA
jgi:hypothetical protein